MAGSERAEVKHRGTHHVEQRTHAADVGFLTADHEDQLGCLCAALRSGDRASNTPRDAASSVRASVSQGYDDEVSRTSPGLRPPKQAASRHQRLHDGAVSTIVTTMSRARELGR